jgi:hypothetical protein
LYKSDDDATVALMNRILDDSETVDQLTLVLRSGSAQGTLSGSVLISSQGIANNVGDNTIVNISFVVSGKPTGTL